jgi:hypothetical protein
MYFSISRHTKSHFIVVLYVGMHELCIIILHTSLCFLVIYFLYYVLQFIEKLNRLEKFYEQVINDRHDR